MRLVSRFEADLLAILHAILGRAPIEEEVRKVVRTCPRPACLSRDAIALIQEALAKGTAHLLARWGGWHRARHLRGERIAAGRLWERTPPEELGLSFSRHSLRFLIWLTAENPGTRPARWSPPPAELTVGDLVLLYFAYDALRGTSVAKDLLALPPFARHGLCGLAFPDDYADFGVEGHPALKPWVSGPGACVVEALQPRLADRWLEVERRKGRFADAATMRALGAAQDRALEAFFAAADAAGRRDLARFLLVAAAGLLRDAPRARAWVGGLDLKGLRLADRVEIYRAAGALLRRLDRFRAWEADARAVGYFDEGYQAAQLYKADWEEWGGATLRERAEAILRELEPLAI